MAAFSPKKAAATLLKARRERGAIPLPSPGPADMKQAFAVQDAVAAALGPVAAWKVGRGGNAAPFATDHLRVSPCRWPAGEFFRSAVELEVAFLLDRDVGQGGHAPSEDELRGAIRSVHAAIEIADSRFDTWPVPDKLWALADHQSAGGLVVEPKGVPWVGAPLERARVSLLIDGKPAFEGEGTNPGGEPFPLLQQLAAHCAARGGIAAGTYVTTGSLTGMIFVEPGVEVAGEIEGVGRVELALTR